MRVLIAGRNGQLAWELTRTGPLGFEVLALGRDELDIRDLTAVERAVADFLPQVIVNTAAYTAVDRAEEEEEQAFALNAHGAANLALAAEKQGAHLVHISTDFVFDGTKSSPYLPDDPVNPLGVYGASKLAGEREVERIMADRAAILRTAWLYSAHGNNFVKTMLRFMAERENLAVVADQVGTPSWARGLSEVVWTIIPKRLAGHFHWTDAGLASWYDFAVAIQEEACDAGLLDRKIPIRPINSEEYPLPARRPFYSVLDKAKTWRALESVPVHWRQNLRLMLQELKEEQRG